MKPDSELCLRVATRLADLVGRGAIVDFWCPDDPRYSKSARSGEQFIELVATAADGTVIALEHTTIESFDHQLHEARQIEALLLPLESQLVERLPADRTYRLAVGIGAVADPALDPTEIQAGLIPWIVATAPTLAAGNPRSPHGTKRTEGRPFCQYTLSSPPGLRQRAALAGGSPCGGPATANHRQTWIDVSHASEQL